MAVAQLVLDYLRALVWPAMVVFLVVRLSPQLRDAADNFAARVSKLESGRLPGGIELTFARESELAALELSGATHIPAPEPMAGDVSRSGSANRDSPQADGDDDGLSDAMEWITGLDPLAADVDADGISDVLEIVGNAPSGSAGDADFGQLAEALELVVKPQVLRALRHLKDFAVEHGVPQTPTLDDLTDASSAVYGIRTAYERLTQYIDEVGRSVGIEGRRSPEQMLREVGQVTGRPGWSGIALALDRLSRLRSLTQGREPTHQEMLLFLDRANQAGRAIRALYSPVVRASAAV